MKKIMLKLALLYPFCIIMVIGIIGFLTISNSNLLNHMKLEVTEGNEADLEMSNSTLYYKMLALEEAYAEMNVRLSEERLEELEASIKKDYEMKIATAKKEAKLEAHPVGSIYISLEEENPSEQFGGTWEKVSEGRVLMGANDSHPIGTTAEAGLPNITGTVSPNFLASGFPTAGTVYGSGALTGQVSQTTNKYAYTGGGIYHGGKLNFDASRSNAIYGKSTTVQPPALFVNIWKRVK